MRGAAMRALAGLLLLLLPGGQAACPNLCNNNGLCGINNVCICHQGFTGADCSLRTCPYGTAWVDKTTAIDTAHADSECSGAGLCDSSSGECKCFDGFTGHACQRSTCHNNCNNKGQCISMADLALYYGNDYDPTLFSAGDGFGPVYSNWEKNSMLTCVCDYGFFGPDCSLVMCPKGDDPVTINQVYRQIYLDVVDGGGSGTFTGMLGVTFQGSTSFITLGTPSSDNCESVLEANPKFGDVMCTYRALSSTSRRFDITFVSWPTLPKENNLFTHNGNPSTTEFLCDLTKTDSTIQCTFSDVVASNLREYEYCSSRGICDFTTGNCLCASGYGGIACDRVHTEYLDFSNADVYQEVAVKSSNYRSAAVNISSVKSSSPDFKLLEASSNSKSFYVRGDGLVAADSLRILESGLTVAKGGTMVQSGGINITADGLAITNAESSSPVLSAQSTDTSFDDTVLEIRAMSYSPHKPYILRAMNQDFNRFSVRGDGLVEIADSGLYVTGGISTGSGGVSAKGGMTVHDDGLTITGGMTVSTDGTTFSDGVDILSRGMKVTSGTTVETTGLVVSQGGLAVDLGGQTLSAGGLLVSAGGVSVVSSGLVATGGLTVMSGGMKSTHGGTVFSSGLKVSDGISVYTGGTKVDNTGVSILANGMSVRSGGMTVESTGVKVTGGLSVFSGLAVNNNGASVTAIGLKVTGGTTVYTAGLNVLTAAATVTGGYSVLGSGLTVTSGITVDTNGAYIIGGATVSAAGVKITGGLSVSSTGLQVDQSSLTVTGGLTISSSGVNNIGAGLTIVDTGLFVANGGTISAGGLRVSDGLTISSGVLHVEAAGILMTGGLSVGSSGANVNGGVTVVDTGLYVVSGGLTVSANGMTVADGVSVETGGLNVNAGGIKITGGLSIQNTGFSESGMTISDTGLAIANGATVAVDGLKVAGGVTISSVGVNVDVGGIDAAGGVTIHDSGMVVGGGISVTNTGIEVLANGVTVSAGGMKVGGALTVGNTGVHVDVSGLGVTGGFSVQNSGATVKGGVTVTNTGLVVSAAGGSVSGGLKVANGITLDDSDMVIGQNLEVGGTWRSYSGAKVTSGLTVQNSNLQVSGGGATIVGNVYIAQSMTITGNLYGASLNFIPSDRRLKTDIVPLKDNLDSVTKLRGVYFNWRNDTVYGKETRRQIGVIAQDVKAVFPDVTTSILDDEYLGVDYVQLIPVLIEAIRELSANYQVLSDTYDELDARTADCEQMNE